MMRWMVSDVLQTPGTIEDNGGMDKMGRDRTRSRGNKSTLFPHIEMWIVTVSNTNLQFKDWKSETFLQFVDGIFAQFELEF